MRARAARLQSKSNKVLTHLGQSTGGSDLLQKGNDVEFEGRAILSVTGDSQSQEDFLQRSYKLPGFLFLETNLHLFVS